MIQLRRSGVFDESQPEAFFAKMAAGTADVGRSTTTAATNSIITIGTPPTTTTATSLDFEKA
jgi:hypothetical protein